MDHACDIVNHMPEAGKQTPAEKAGADVLDIDTTLGLKHGTMIISIVEKV